MVELLVTHPAALAALVIGEVIFFDGIVRIIREIKGGISIDELFGYEEDLDDDI